MTRRLPPLLTLALAAACGGGAAVSGAGPSAPTSAPIVAASTYRAGGPWHYLYQRADTFISLLPNGDRQRLVLERKLQLAWQVTSSASGLQLAVTIDSVQVYGVPGGARAMEDSARGTVIRGELTTQGRLAGLKASSDNGIAHALVADLPWLVPMLGGVEAPRTDTLDASIRFNVVDVAERTVRSTAAGASFQMMGNVTRDGVSPQLNLSGTGIRLGSAMLGNDGKPGLGTGRDSVAMKATVVSIGQSIDIVQLGGYTLTPLP